MASGKKTTLKDEDIVHASWRHDEKREQGIRRGTCGWITSYDIKWVNQTPKTHVNQKVY